LIADCRLERDHDSTAGKTDRQRNLELTNQSAIGNRQWSQSTIVNRQSTMIQIRPSNTKISTMINTNPSVPLGA
jgi:hypothetical protein